MGFISAFKRETGFKTVKYKSAFDYMPSAPNVEKPTKRVIAVTKKNLNKVRKQPGTLAGTLAGRLITQNRRF